jgi:hypothetical protein
MSRQTAVEDTEYKFPDEEDSAAKGEKSSDEPEIQIEIEDDTPPEDRNRTPLPRPLVEELDKDELDKYDDTVKEKLKQMRKVWHDERREKEAAMREHREAMNIAQRLLQENQRYKEVLNTGEKQYVTMMKDKATAEVAIAKRAFREAYDAGDADKVIEAQEALNAAQLSLIEADRFRVPALQDDNFQEQSNYQPQNVVSVDPKAEAWQKRNPWFGQDEEMTAAALGLHRKLEKQGVVVGSDDYYGALDKTMRKRFPETFGEEQQEEPVREQPRTRASTVVAPAMRSTAPQKVRLKMSQLNLIKKLGIPPEQYVKEYLKVNQNG